MIMSELCPNCPLYEVSSNPSSIEETVKFMEADPNRESDRRAITKTLNSEAIFEALKLERPKQCEVLDKVLPGYDDRHPNRKHAIPRTICPTVALAAALTRDK